MSTIDKRQARTKQFAGVARPEVVIDFAETPYNANDLIKLFDTYPKDCVATVFVTVEVPEGGTATGDIGDYTTGMVAVDADGFHAGVDLNAAAGTVAAGAGAYAAAVRCYGAQNVIALKLNHNMDAGKYRFELVLLPAARP